MARRPSSARLSACNLLRKSLLLAEKWPDRHQTCTWWTPGQHTSRVCSRSRSSSKVTWYAHFLGFLEWATPSLAVWFTFSLLWACGRQSADIMHSLSVFYSYLLKIIVCQRRSVTTTFDLITSGSCGRFFPRFSATSTWPSCTVIAR